MTCYALRRDCQRPLDLRCIERKCRPPTLDERVVGALELFGFRSLDADFFIRVDASGNLSSFNADTFRTLLFFGCLDGDKSLLLGFRSSLIETEDVVGSVGL